MKRIFTGIIALVATSAFTTPVLAEPEKNHIPIRYDGFEVILDCRERAPIFFHFNPKFDTANYDRKEEFSLDPNIPKECQQTSTKPYHIPYEIYATLGKEKRYHRGHFVDANSMDFSPEAIAMTNYMTNIIPMTQTVNQYGAWRGTEEYTECLRDRLPNPEFSDDKRSFSVMGGPIWGDNEDNDYFMNTHGVRTPDYLWKVLYDKDALLNDEPSVIAWIIPNSHDAVKRNLPDYRVKVSEIERHIGFALPIRAELKQRDDMPLWEVPEKCNQS